ncbi:MAG: hypothetical protein EBZ77_05185 [Chitinophagia bacterium]|nr:hypothetical protein [Chitinophagia bacterium]
MENDCDVGDVDSEPKNCRFVRENGPALMSPMEPLSQMSEVCVDDVQPKYPLREIGVPRIASDPANWT